MLKKKIAVLFGGVSSEYEVSLRSVSSVIRNIDTELFSVIPIGITKRGRWLYFPGPVELIENDTWHKSPDCVPAIISPDRVSGGIIRFAEDGSAVSFEKVDAVIPVLHGKNGEDGTMQGLFELAGIPYVGPGVLASAVCMDKAVANAMMDYYGVPHCEWTSITAAQSADIDRIAEDFEKRVAYPIIVKPACAGSSVGVSKAHNRDELRAGVLAAFAHDSKVVLERCIVGREIECAVLGNDKPVASHLGEILPPEGEMYTYEEKYSSVSETGLAIPAKLAPELEEAIRKIAVSAYMLFGCKGLSRVDFFVENGRPYLNEINTLPGFTSISMYPKLMEHLGISTKEIITRLIELSLGEER